MTGIFNLFGRVHPHISLPTVECNLCYQSGMTPSEFINHRKTKYHKGNLYKLYRGRLPSFLQQIDATFCVEGYAVNLVDKKWYDDAMTFIAQLARRGCAGKRPGNIDNSRLLKLSTNGRWELKDHLKEDVDYVVVHKELWYALSDLFGVEDDRDTIEAYVTEGGFDLGMSEVDIYSIKLKLKIRMNDYTCVEKERFFNRSTTLLDLENEMKKMGAMNPSIPTKLYYSKARINIDDKITIQDVGLWHGDEIELKVLPQNGSSITRSAKSIADSVTKLRTYSRELLVPGLCGLTNLGNMCYMNSILQCLSNTPPLVTFFTSDMYLADVNRTNPNGTGGILAEACGIMFKNMWSGERKCFMPRDVHDMMKIFGPQFNGNEEQDSQEFLSFFLDRMHEDVKRNAEEPFIELKTDVDQQSDHVAANEWWKDYKKDDNSIIVDTFHGLLKSTLVCPDCRQPTGEFSPFSYLLLPLHKPMSHSRGSIRLSECIDNFTAPEKLGADDLWCCPTCDLPQQATKKIDLYKMPNVLIICLQRFSNTGSECIKLDTMVDFPITGLDMGANVVQDPDEKSHVYDLIAVSNHCGSLDRGHYTAFAKNNGTNRWHCFDDSKVSNLDERDVVSKDAYLLFYLKRNGAGIQ